MALDITDLKLSGTIKLAAGSTLTTDAGVVVDLSGANVTIPAFTPGTENAAGKSGAVPAPAAGDAAAKKFLSARGLWEYPDPMTAEGDMTIGGAGGVPTRLPKGANGQVLTLAAGRPAWRASQGGSGGGSENTNVQAPGWPQRSGALSGTIISSVAHDGGYNAAAAFNGLTPASDPSGSFAQTDTAFGFLGLDFGEGKTVTLSKVSVFPGPTGDLNQTGPLNIETSQDGTTWNTVGATSGPCSANTWQDNNLSASAARFVRVSVSGKFMNLAELEFYGARISNATGGGSSGGGATTPNIVSKLFAKGTNPSVTIPATTAGNLLVLVMLGYSGVTGSNPPAGYVQILNAAPVSAQGAWVGYRVADGTEGGATYAYSFGDQGSLSYFELDNPFSILASIGAPSATGSNVTVVPTAYVPGSLRLVFVEWDNAVNVTGVSGGDATLLHAFGDANHRGGAASVTTSPLIPVMFAVDGGPDRPEYVVVEIAGAVASGGGGGSGGGHVLTYAADGDAFGLFYYLGTGAGSGAWSNPVTSGALTITAGPGGFDAGNASQIVDRASSEVHTPNTPGGYYIFDLGTSHTFNPSKWSYRARNNDGSSCPTGMRFQGSNDGSAWTVLNTRTGINITAGNQWLTYTVPTQSTAFRYFRLLQVDPNNSGANNFFFIGEFELYGTLYTS